MIFVIAKGIAFPIIYVIKRIGALNGICKQFLFFIKKKLFFRPNYYRYINIHGEMEVFGSYTPVVRTAIFWI